MAIFYWHAHNKIPKELAEITRARGFMYNSRGELEFKFQTLVTDLGYDIYASCHTIIMNHGTPMNEQFELNPDNELDRYALKLCKQNVPWSAVKFVNGRDMMFMMGYTSHGGDNPFGMSTIQMAQKGITSATFVPRAM